MYNNHLIVQINQICNVLSISVILWKLLNQLLSVVFMKYMYLDIIELEVVFILQ